MFGKNYVQRIMIVEDDELIRKELSRFLTYEGYEAVCIEKFENDFQTAEVFFRRRRIWCFWMCRFRDATDFLSVMN